MSMAQNIPVAEPGSPPVASPTTIVYENSYQTPAVPEVQADPNAAYKPGDPAAPLAPEVPVQEAAPVDPFPALTPDGQFVNIYVTNPETGAREYYTRIPNTPEAISSYAGNQQAFIERSRQSFTRQPEVQQPPAQTSKRDALVAKAKQVAEARYKGAYPDADIDPLAEALADFGEILLDEVGGDRKAETRAAKMRAEVAQIQKIDPRFDPQNQFVQKVRGYLAQELGADPTPTVVHGYIMALEAQARMEQGQPPANGNGHQFQQPAPKPLVPTSPPNMFTSPTGSQPVSGAGDAYDTHPEVVSAVNTYHQEMIKMGRQPTAEGLASVRTFAKQSLVNRGTFIPTGHSNGNR